MYELNKLCGEITKKLDNTVEYESWLIIKDYIDSFKQAINEIKEYINNTDTFVINGKIMKLKDETSGQNILQIIDKF